MSYFINQGTSFWKWFLFYQINNFLFDKELTQLREKFALQLQIDFEYLKKKLNASKFCWVYNEQNVHYFKMYQTPAKVFEHCRSIILYFYLRVIYLLCPFVASAHIFFSFCENINPIGVWIGTVSVLRHPIRFSILIRFRNNFDGDLSFENC